MDPQDFRTFFNEKLKTSGLTIKKLSEMSGIPPKYLVSLSEGDISRLPPSPYLRGYLVNLGKILEFSGEEWWNKFREGGDILTPGSQDALPQNRFAPRSLSRYVWGGLIAVLLLVYLVTRLSHLTGKPKLTIYFPPETMIETKDSKLTIRGTVSNGDEVFINGQSVPKRDGGEWEMSIGLESGINTIEVKAKKFLGSEVKLSRQVIYSAPVAVPAPTSTEASSSLKSGE